MATQFCGFEQFIATVDDAVAAESPDKITKALRSGLCRLIRCPDVKLPDCVFETCDDHYARRELYHSPRHGYTVVAMTWGPGQGTLIHDHCGMWCVEGVWQGELEVVQYDLVERDGERFRFRSVGAIQAGSGSAGSLIPPHEYHTICNANADEPAISVHVYSGQLTNCNVFQPEEGDWYRRHPRTIGVDAHIAV